MNKEIVKAMNRKPNNFKKWWAKNGYKVWRVILFPIWLCVWGKGKIDNFLYARSFANSSWDEERADEILNYYIPRCSNWDEDTKSFYFFDNGYGWDMRFAKKHLKRKDRNFWRHNEYNIRRYLVENFELEGFTKELGYCYDSSTEITFHMIEG